MIVLANWAVSRRKRTTGWEDAAATDSEGTGAVELATGGGRAGGRRGACLIDGWRRDDTLRLLLEHPKIQNFIRFSIISNLATHA